MKTYVYDFEVLKYDWLVVFQDYDTGEFYAFHNDNEAVAEFMNTDDVYIGFNSKGYDQHILKAVCCGFDNEDIKSINDYIIAGGNGWDHPMVQQCYYRFNNVDIMDDMQIGQSLKSIEGHLGMMIKESSIDFDIDRPLTEAELEEMLFYCKHDVEATRELVKLRKNYLQSKIDIGRMVGIDDVKALSMTNAKLTAAFLKARKPDTPRTDERQYKYPENLKKEYIPQEVFDFFNRMYDPSVSDDELFKSKLNIVIGGTPAVVGFGGIHSALPNYIRKKVSGV